MIRHPTSHIRLVPLPPAGSYAQSVEILRDLSRSHAAAATRMCTGSSLDDGMDMPVNALGEMIHAFEDQALRCLCALARLTSVETAFLAIDEAHADWLRAVVLNRAVETALI
jgi:hypothetical protein